MNPLNRFGRYPCTPIRQSSVVRKNDRRSYVSEDLRRSTTELRRNDLHQSRADGTRTHDIRLLKHVLQLGSRSSVARQGIEPCLTVSKTVVRIHHTRKPCCFHQCPCQESNLIFDLRRVACVSTTLHRHFLPSGAGGIRTHKHLFLRQAAQPLAYHTR